MPMIPNNMTKPKTMHIHDQHGQSAFNPKARIRLNEVEGGRSVVGTYLVVAVVSCEIYIFMFTKSHTHICI